MIKAETKFAVAGGMNSGWRNCLARFFNSIANYLLRFAWTSAKKAFSPGLNHHPGLKWADG
jgi:hypothetical protein